MKKFNGHFIKRVSNDTEKQPRNTYHYTSPDAFLSIIKNECIRFSDIRYMNDKSETVYAVKLLLDFLQENRGKYLFVEDVLDKLIGKQFYSDIQELRTTNVSFNQIPGFDCLTNRSFLFCLSTKKDALNMWNYYVKNGHYEGYNIGFDLYELLKTFDVPQANTSDAFLIYHGKVVYKKELQYRVIEKIVDEVEKISENSQIDMKLPYAAVTLRNKLESEGLFIKHPEFSSEQEYRIVLHIAEKRIPHNEEEGANFFGTNNKSIIEDFCIKNGLVVPFLKVKLPSLSISKVTVSPITEFDLVSKGISELLEVHNFKNVEIQQSKIPIRF